MLKILSAQLFFCGFGVVSIDIRVAESTVEPVSIVSTMLVMTLSGPPKKKVECDPISKRMCLSLELI